MPRFGPEANCLHMTDRDSLRVDKVSYCPVIWENVMKIVPVIKSGDLERSVLFYTRILDFERKWPGHEDREMTQLIHRPLSASRRTRLLIVVY
jgi:hypothetical protein